MWARIIEQEKAKNIDPSVYDRSIRVEYEPKKVPCKVLNSREIVK
jgi:hypothetical protein